MSRKYTRLLGEQQSEVCRQYKAGESIEALKRSVGASSTCIRNALIRHGVRLRTLSESVRGKLNHFFGKSHSLESRRKMSAALTGRAASDETRRRLSEVKSGNKYWLGKYHADETKRKLSEINKGKQLSELTRRRISEAKRGKHLSEETRKKMSFTHKGMPSYNKGRCPSEETRRRMSEARKGEKNANWRGGIAFLPYCPKFNRELKEQVRERDNRICQLCGIKENGTKLRVHHVHYDKPNCDPDLISLCHSCHAKTNGNRDFYEDMFMEKLRERGLVRGGV